MKPSVKLILAAVAALLLAASVAALPRRAGYRGDPGICCSPDQWETRFEFIQTGSKFVRGLGSISHDFTGERQLVNFTYYLPNGTTLRQRHLIKGGRKYMIDDTARSCSSYEDDLSRICVGRKLRYTETVALGDEKGRINGLVFQDVSGATARIRTIVTESLCNVVSSRQIIEGTGVAVYSMFNTTAGISDCCVFDIPSFCKSTPDQLDYLDGRPAAARFGGRNCPLFSQCWFKKNFELV